MVAGLVLQCAFDRLWFAGLRERRNLTAHRDHDLLDEPERSLIHRHRLVQRFEVIRIGRRIRDLVLLQKLRDRQSQSQSDHLVGVVSRCVHVHLGLRRHIEHKREPIARGHNGITGI